MNYTNITTTTTTIYNNSSMLGLLFTDQNVANLVLNITMSVIAFIATVSSYLFQYYHKKHVSKQDEKINSFEHTLEEQKNNINVVNNLIETISQQIQQTPRSQITMTPRPSNVPYADDVVILDNIIDQIEHITLKNGVQYIKK